MSKLRKTYLIRLALRCLIFSGGIWILIADPVQSEILRGWNFFRKFSVFHLLWGVWILEMLEQIFPIRVPLPIGSQKLFHFRFQPSMEPLDQSALRRYSRNAAWSAYAKVWVLWMVLLAGICALYAGGWLAMRGLLIVTLAFYVCDLICVLIWCPFRLMLGNRCCTTCRIFNWDHLMMFTPMLPIRGFYSLSLIVLSGIAWLVWEAHVIRYPERFWEKSNTALRCSSCTDKLCTQYCQKRA